MYSSSHSQNPSYFATNLAFQKYNSLKIWSCCKFVRLFLIVIHINFWLKTAPSQNIPLGIGRSEVSVNRFTFWRRDKNKSQGVMPCCHIPFTHAENTCLLRATDTYILAVQANSSVHRFLLSLHVDPIDNSNRMTVS